MFDFFKLQEIIYLSFLDYKPIWIYFIVAALIFVIVNSMYRFYKSKNWEVWILTVLNVGTCLLFCTLMLFHFFNLPSALTLKNGKVIPLCYELSELHFEKEICSLCPQREFVFNKCVLREGLSFPLSILKK
jgi:hypothetical protein